MFRLISLGLLVFPLEGHWGYGSWASEGSVSHYIHHAKFNWNYGSSTMWDHLMGTNYPGDTGQDGLREQQAKEQARMVNCTLTAGNLAPEMKKKE